MAKTLLLCVFALLIQSGAQAEVNYCGKLTSVGYENDIWTNYRMGILNKDRREPQYVTVKDEAAVAKAMELVAKNNPDYPADYTSFDWRAKDDQNNSYWVCIKGSDFPDYGPFVQEVTSMTFWHNGVKQ
ncbi:MAG: hypothetical protein H6624_08080 [Bdellovibrionaceae bacterium]|nr:hypothetical protein [Bdellovibrionales bacterium]MCB9084290.1 hypothetical protein [Pseudobdellovibrionaceae bacterium]